MMIICMVWALEVSLLKRFIHRVEKQTIETLEEEQDYSELKVAELKELLADRGLQFGRKAELIERLEEDDESGVGDLLDIDDVWRRSCYDL